MQITSETQATLPGSIIRVMVNRKVSAKHRSRHPSMEFHTGVRSRLSLRNVRGLDPVCRSHSFVRAVTAAYWSKGVDTFQLLSERPSTRVVTPAETFVPADAKQVPETASSLLLLKPVMSA